MLEKGGKLRVVSSMTIAPEPLALKRAIVGGASTYPSAAAA